MPKNEDGEFELILGNRQLLSVFFIVVVLLGVFFTMGYIVGRNSGPVGLGGGGGVRARNRSRWWSIRPRRAMPLRRPRPPPRRPRKRRRNNLQSEPLPSLRSTLRPNRPPKPKPKERPKPVPVAPAATDQPASGQTYLQLAATSQHEAEIEVDVLRKKGFKAITAEIPEKRGTFESWWGRCPKARPTRPSPT